MNLGGAVMEYRKLIKFGNSSHIISLPTNWIRKNKLKKGDLIYFEENGNNELVLNSEIKKERIEPKEIVIDLFNKDNDEIKREIHSAYINNFNTINLTGRNLNEKEVLIRKIISNLMALEIVEHSENKIMLKDFLDMDKIFIENMIRKIDILIRAILYDFKSVDNSEKFEAIYRKDYDVNKLTFLVYRAVKYIINNPSAIKDNKFDTWKLMNYWQLADRLERIGDEAKRVARALMKINLDSKEFKKLVDLLNRIEAFYGGVMNAYHKSDVQALYKILKLKDDLIKDCDNYFNLYKRKDLVPSIIDKLKDMIDHIRTIARLLYN